MVRRLLWIWLIALMGLCAKALAAGPIVLTEHSSGLSLNQQIDLFEDTTGQLTIEQISAPEFAKRFQPAHGLAGVGLSDNPWWIRLRLTRTSNAPHSWYLENGSINIRDFRLYLKDDLGLWQERQSGERVPFAQGRDYLGRTFVFKLPSLTDDELLVYARAYNPAGNLFPLKAWQHQDLIERTQQENFIYGTVYGCIVALLLYNLCLLTIFRDKGYFWYVLLTACGLLVALCTSGHGFQYLWPDNPVPFWLDRTTLPSLWSILLIQFTMVMLYTRDGLKWTHWIFWPITALYVLGIVANGLGLIKLAAQIMTFVPLVGIPVALWCALVRSSDFVPARIYLLAYAVVFSSAVTLLLRSVGVIEPHPLISYLFPFSVALESLLFAFALAYRIQILRQEKEYALKLASQEKSARISQFQHSALELQRLVQERTQELAQANERLRGREQALEQAAHHDALTGLPNRRYLLSHAQQALNYAERHQSPAALMLIDLDHFKPINDHYGHDAGDHVLRVIAKRLRDNIRAHDMVARLGGDEFAILISGSDAAQQACEIAERLLKAQSLSVSYDDHLLDVGISMGIAEYPIHGQDFHSLYQIADKALYQAKHRGRSCYVRYGLDEISTALAPAQ